LKYTGELAALLTAVFWTVTGLAFELAGRKVGSLSVNLIRLVLAFLFLSVYLSISRGMFFPSDAGRQQWIWLSLSGLIGFVIGDLFLFQAYVVIGARISQLIMSLTPPITAFIGWVMLGEVLSPMNWIGMAVTISGIGMVVLKREKANGNNILKNKLTTSYSVRGILLAVGGALGQAAGLVLSKKGMGDYDAFASTQIRILTGLAGFSIIMFLTRRWMNVFRALGNRSAMSGIAVGSFFGPFLGVSFSLLAVQHIQSGIAATIMAIVPVLIIPPAILIFREKFNWKEIAGAGIAVAGVMLFFL
jgi:drug/metabolite transporter (DMT)-like permease